MHDSLGGGRAPQLFVQLSNICSLMCIFLAAL
nr:MAG TPA: hypothetical protein [Caudoviricetes sp.]